MLRKAGISVGEQQQHLEVIRNALELCTIEKSSASVKYMNEFSNDTSGLQATLMRVHLCAINFWWLVCLSHAIRLSLKQSLIMHT